MSTVTRLRPSKSAAIEASIPAAPKLPWRRQRPGLLRLARRDTLVGWAPMVLALAISWSAAIAIGFLVVQGHAGLIGVLAVLGPVLLFDAYVIRLSRSVAGQQAREVAFAREREELLRQTLGISDRERQRLAGDLHDGVIQLVSAMVLRTATIARGLRREEHVSPERLATTLAGLDRITMEMQAVAGDLRGLMGALANAGAERNGLAAALTELVAPLAELGLEVQISVGEIDCDPDQRSLLYRIAQELVRNVAKHATAKLVVLRLSTVAEGILLTITDDGQGFEPADVRRQRGQGSLGLSLLEQRVHDAGGQLRIDSLPGRGTTAQALIPAH